MNTIKRDVYVLRNTIKIPIEVTKGTDAISFEFTVRDYNLPATAAAVAYAYRMGMKKPNSTLCDVSGNVISFQPSVNFFEVGNNELQIRVINEEKSLISFKEKVKCSDSMGFPDEEEEADKSLIEQIIAQSGKESGERKAADEKEQSERKTADETEKSERIAADAKEKSERQKEIATERARIDQLTKMGEGSTTGDAELADIRAGNEGATYSNAGNAVRAQTKGVPVMMDNLQSPYVDISLLEQGSINSAVGSEIASSKALRSVEFHWNKNGKITAPAGYKIAIANYAMQPEESGQMTKVYMSFENYSDSQTSSKADGDAESRRLLIKRSDGADINAEDLRGKIVTNVPELRAMDVIENLEKKIKTDTTLEKEGVAADAAETGKRISKVERDIGLQKEDLNIDKIVSILPIYKDRLNKKMYASNGVVKIVDASNFNVSDDIVIPKWAKTLVCENLVNNKSAANIAFYDDVPETNKSIGYYLNDTSVQFSGEIKIPDGAKYMLVSGNQTNTAVSISFTIKFSYSEYIKSLENEIVQINGVDLIGNRTLDELGIQKKLKNPIEKLSFAFGTIENKKSVRYYDGVVVASAIYKTVTFDVSLLRKQGALYIGAELYARDEGNDASQGMAFYNADGEYIIGYTTTQMKVAEFRQVPLPENATTLKYSYCAETKYGYTKQEVDDITVYYESFVKDDDEYKKLKNDVRTNSEEIQKLKTNEEQIVIGSKLYAVVGDTLQVFYKSILNIKGNMDDYILKFECNKGKNYPRYWEVTPTVGDVGTYSITITLYDLDGKEIVTKVLSLIIKSANNPETVKNILCIGDSTMQSGQIPIEASRRFKGTTGKAINPPSMNLNNFNLVGRIKNSDNSVGWEGTGGWTWSSYNSAGTKAVRFNVTGADNLNIADVYQVGNFKLSISEINITDGNGNIRCIFSYLTPYNKSFDADTPQTGTLNLTSGNGQNNISYNSVTVESYQPFWNSETNSFDITSYVERYCNDSLSAICVLLGINSLINREPFMNTETVVNDAKTFLRNIHSQLPDCKIIVSTIPLASPNGGIAANYGSGSTAGKYSSKGFNQKVYDYNQKIIELENHEEFSDYLIVVSSHAQFDIDNSYPTIEKALNTRSTKNEQLQSNGVHPSDEGYWQISDGLVFRPVVCLIN